MIKAEALAVVFVSMAALAASAQEQARPAGVNLLAMQGPLDGLRPGPYGVMGLLKNPAIQKELGLTEDQKAKVKDVEEQFRQARERQGKDLQAKQDRARAEKDKDEFIRLNEALHTLSADLARQADEAILAKVLNRPQRARFGEIRLQADGVSAFKRPEIRESLGLDAEQIQEIASIDLQGFREMRKAASLPAGIELPKSVGPESPVAKAYARAVGDARGRMIDVRVSTMKAIEKILTKAQRAKYRNMIGEPFQFVKPRDEGRTDKGEGEKGKGDVADPR